MTLIFHRLLQRPLTLSSILSIISAEVKLSFPHELISSELSLDHPHAGQHQ